MKKPELTDSCTDVFFAMLPTTFGIWFDNWNVKAFLVDERARIYAKKFKDPQYCTYCGFVHVPYEELIKSTSKTVSLCWQLVPLVGIIMGKVCEYCNFPPLYYRGKSMPCLYTQDMYSYRQYPELPPLKRKAGAVKKLKRSISLFLVKFVSQKGGMKLGMVRAALSLYLLGTAFFFVFFVSTKNIAVVMPLLGFAFFAAQVKGLGDLALWVWINFICTHDSKHEKTQKKVEKAEKKLEQKLKAKRNPENAGMVMRAWILMGGTWGTTLTILISFGDLEGFVSAQQRLIFRSLVLAFISMVYNFLAASLSVMSDQLERLAPACNSICRLVLYGVPLTSVFFLALRVSDLRAACIITLVIFTFQITVDWTNLEGKAQHLPTTIDGYIPGMVALPLGTFLGGLTGLVFLGLFQSPFAGWAVGFWIGTITSLSAGIGMTVILNNKPFIYGLRWGLIVGIASFVLFGMQGGLYGFLIGAVLVAMKTEWLVFNEYQAQYAAERKEKRRVFLRYADIMAEKAAKDAELKPYGDDTESTIDSSNSDNSYGASVGPAPLADVTESWQSRDLDGPLRDIDDKELTKQELRDQIRALSAEVSTSVGNTSAYDSLRLPGDDSLRLPGAVAEFDSGLVQQLDDEDSLRLRLDHHHDELNSLRRAGGASLDEPDVETFFESEMQMTDFTFPSEVYPEPPPIPDAPPLPLEPYEESVAVAIPRDVVFDTSGREFDQRYAPETVDAEFGEHTPAGTPRRLMARRFDEPPDGSGAAEIKFTGPATRLSLSEKGRIAKEANVQHRHAMRAARVRNAWSPSAQQQRASDAWQRDYGPPTAKPRAPRDPGKRYR